MYWGPAVQTVSLGTLRGPWWRVWGGLRAAKPPLTNPEHHLSLSDSDRLRLLLRICRMLQKKMILHTLSSEEQRSAISRLNENACMHFFFIRSLTHGVHLWLDAVALGVHNQLHAFRKLATQAFHIEVGVDVLANATKSSRVLCRCLLPRPQRL